MQDCEFLIEIFVPLKGADGAGCVGTGYPIAQDRIITARHVLGDNPQIKVRWYYAPDRTNDADGGVIDQGLRRWIDLDPAETSLAFEDLNLDIAVLKCSFPDGLQEWCPLRENSLSKGTRWCSEGFIAAGKRDDHRNAEAFSGTVENDLERDGTMVLSVTTPPQFDSADQKKDPANRRNDTLWSGGSGSPVIVSGALAGVVTRCPPDYGAARLRAVPMATLFKNERFRQSIGFDDQVRWRGKIAHDAKQILKSSLGLTDELIRQLRIEGLADDTAKKVSRVVEKLFDLAVGEFLEAIDAVHERLMERGFHAESKTLLDLTHMMLPGLRGIAGQHVYSGNSETNVRNWHCATMLTLPAACATVAEVLMANREGRRTRFKAPTRVADYPEGESKFDDGKLTTRIEAGIDPGPSDLAAAIHFLKHDCYLVSSDDLREDHTDEFYVQLLRNTFRSLQKQKRSCYFAVRLPSKPDELNRWTILVRELKKMFPALTFIRLADDESLLLSERDKYLPLRQIYSRTIKS